MRKSRFTEQQIIVMIGEHESDGRSGTHACGSKDPFTNN